MPSLKVGKNQNFFAIRVLQSSLEGFVYCHGERGGGDDRAVLQLGVECTTTCAFYQ